MSMNDSKNARDYFEQSIDKRAIPENSARGLRVVFASQSLKFILLVISNICLARLLMPEDFGLVAMAVAFTGFLILFRDMGISAAIIQKETISDAETSNVFWLNLCVTISLSALIFMAAPLITSFYADQRLNAILQVIALIFVIEGIAQLHYALLKRNMLFKKIAAIQVLALALGVTGGIWAALGGLNYWSLLLMQLINVSIMTLGYWYQCRWRPQLYDSKTDIRGLLKFGGFMTANSIATYLNRNSDDILIGRVLGGIATGYYSRAYSLLNLPLGQIVSPMTSVAVPALSRSKSYPDAYAKLYYSYVSSLSYLTMPMIAYLGSNASILIPLLLGEHWLVSAELFQILAIAVFFQPLASSTGWIFVSSGRAREMFIAAALAVPIIVGAIFIGLDYGVSGVAYCYVIASNSLILPVMFYSYHSTSIELLQTLKKIIFPMVLSAVIIFCHLVTEVVLVAESPLVLLVTSTLLSGLFVIVIYLLSEGVRTDLKSVLSIFKMRREISK